MQSGAEKLILDLVNIRAAKTGRSRGMLRPAVFYGMISF